jgi:hypothetical protein
VFGCSVGPVSRLMRIPDVKLGRTTVSDPISSRSTDDVIAVTTGRIAFPRSAVGRYSTMELCDLGCGLRTSIV